VISDQFSVSPKGFVGERGDSIPAAGVIETETGQKSETRRNVSGIIP
jgi:hypothetical protein